MTPTQTPAKAPIKAIVAIGLPLLFLAWLAYFLRPLAVIHGPLWLLLKYEPLWVWPTIAGTFAGVPVFYWRRDVYQRRLGDRRQGSSRYDYWERPSRTYRQWALGAFGAAGLLTFIFFAIMTPHLMAKATFDHYSYAPITKLPESGVVRVIPREVAQGIAQSSYSTSGHGLKGGNIVLDPQTHELVWSFEQAPNGVVNTYRGQTLGIAMLSAEQTQRTYKEIDRKFKFGPSMKISDSVNWQFRKRHYFGVPTDPIPVVTKAGEPVFVMPWISYKHAGLLLAKYPTLGGVMVFHADGRIDDLSPQQADKDPEIAQTGRIIPEGLAREIQDAYASKLGLANEMFTHRDQTTIQDDPDSDNHMPYLMSFQQNGKQDLKWVSVAEPKGGNAFAVKAVLLTDAVTGKTEVWKAPKNADGTTEALTGPNKAIQLVKSRGIPGITYASQAGEQGKFTVVEPRPVFIHGRLMFLLSIIPSYQPQAVTKSVIVDAAKQQVVAVFNHDDPTNYPNATADLLHYLKTGELSDSAAVGGTAPGTTPGATTPGTPTPGVVSRSTVEQIQAAIDQNKKLQAELRQQQAQLETALKAAKQGK